MNETNEKENTKTCCIVNCIYEDLIRSWPAYDREINNVRRYMDLEIRTLLAVGYKNFIATFTNYAQLEMGKIIQQYKEVDNEISIEIVSHINNCFRWLDFELKLTRDCFIKKINNEKFVEEKSIYTSDDITNYLLNTASLVIILESKNSRNVEFWVEKAKLYNKKYVIINPYSLDEDAKCWFEYNYVKN